MVGWMDFYFFRQGKANIVAVRGSEWDRKAGNMVICGIAPPLPPPPPYVYASIVCVEPVEVLLPARAFMISAWKPRLRFWKYEEPPWAIKLKSWRMTGSGKIQGRAIWSSQWYKTKESGVGHRTKKHPPPLYGIRVFTQPRKMFRLEVIIGMLFLLENKKWWKKKYSSHQL